MSGRGKRLGLKEVCLLSNARLFLVVLACVCASQGRGLADMHMDICASEIAEPSPGGGKRCGSGSRSRTSLGTGVWWQGVQ